MIQEVVVCPAACPSDTQSALPAALVRARRIKRLGLASSSVLLGASGLAAALTGNIHSPLAPDALAAAACAATAVPLATLAAAKAVLGDDLHVEFYDMQPYVEWVPVSGRSCCAGAVEVTPAPAGFA